MGATPYEKARDRMTIRHELELAELEHRHHLERAALARRFGDQRMAAHHQAKADRTEP